MQNYKYSIGCQISVGTSMRGLQAAVSFLDRKASLGLYLTLTSKSHHFSPEKLELASFTLRFSLAEVAGKAPVCHTAVWKSGSLLPDTSVQKNMGICSLPKASVTFSPTSSRAHC